MSKEEAKKLKDWLTIGYVGNVIDSSEPFSKNKEIANLIKKHPYSFKKITEDNLRCVDKKILIYALACCTFAGKDGKHVLNDLFLKFIRTLSDLYYFVSYVKEMRNINETITPYVIKFVRSQSFEKLHKEIIMFRNHETEINFNFLISKCGLTARNEKEELYFKTITSPKSKCHIQLVDDYENLKKGRPATLLNKFSFEMLPNKPILYENKIILENVVKNTNVNTILENIETFNKVDSIKYVSKVSTEPVNKYIAAKAYTKCDEPVKHIIKEKINTKSLKKRICNIIDYDLAGLEQNKYPIKNLPFIFSGQFENVENIIFENHERFRDIDVNIEDILNDDYVSQVKLRENTTIYFDKFMGHLLEENKKVDAFIVWTYGKEFTMKKRPEMMEIYNTYCDRNVKIVFIYFNAQKEFDCSSNVLNLNGFDINRSEDIIKRFLYSDI